MNADFSVWQRDKLMEQHQIKKVIDFYSATLKEAEIPIIQRPPLDDLTLWCNDISGVTIGVIGRKGIKQLENKAGWFKETSCTIYLSGSIIPAEVINAVPRAAQSSAFSSASAEETVRRVPISDYEYNFKYVKDIVKTYEDGCDIYQPGSQWSKALGCWDQRMDGNYLNFIKYYLYIHHNKKEITYDTVLEKSKWRDWITLYYKQQSTNKNFNYPLEADRLRNQSSLLEYFRRI